MTRRLIVVLAILGIGPLGVALAWPFVADKLRTAEVNLALITSPREEIIASGCYNNDEAEAFSLQTLLIEEPGKEPYRRPVTLDANGCFELALGEPREGTYRVAMRTGQADSQSGAAERWLRAPDLVVKRETPLVARKVSSQDFNYAGLLLVALVTLGAQAALLVAWFGQRRPKAATAEK